MLNPDYLTLDEYQLLAADTATYPHAGEGTIPALNYTIHGLTGEAGEISNKFKKVLRDDLSVMLPSKRDELVDEVGDVLWYCARLLTELGHTMEECGKRNIEKLASRKERGVLGGSGDNR